jgi:hypothetical protein
MAIAFLREVSLFSVQAAREFALLRRFGGRRAVLADAICRSLRRWRSDTPAIRGEADGRRARLKHRSTAI